ncbi:MAG: PhoH family protein [Oscillospiraceae bacterium]
MVEQLVNIDGIENALAIFGSYDENIKLLEKELSVKIINRDSVIKVSGNEEDVKKAVQAIEALLYMIKNGETIRQQNVNYILSLVSENNIEQVKNLSDESICITITGKALKPKTLGQKQYIKDIQNNTVVFAVGPAGTGKTYLAVAMAVKAFRAQEVNRIILTRPAVEAGEKLGFLPGDLQMKVDPYLRPLYDALFDMFGAEGYQRLLEKGAIEIAPLAYMRGRTLDESFIILDEAQNTTPEQMKMFLTRLGVDSKAVITGDITQIDLPDPKKSGLIDAINVLSDVSDIAITYFSEKDVVRHKIVQDIIKAYENKNNKK